MGQLRCQSPSLLELIERPLADVINDTDGGSGMCRYTRAHSWMLQMPRKLDQSTR